MATLTENVNNAISDFDSIKSAIENCKVDVGNIPTSEYADKILDVNKNSDLLNSLVSGTAQSVELPQSVEEIRTYCFYNYTNLQSIKIPGSVKVVGSYAFVACKNLEYVCFENGVNTIGKEAFQACTKLTELELTESIETISYGAFKNCTGIKSVIIPNGVKTLGTLAFGYCSGITHLEIPNSITQIMVDSFYYCSNIVELTVEDGFNAGNFNLSYFTGLEVDTLLNVLNALADRTDTTSAVIIFGSTHLAKLTDEQKAIATDKNWILN
ncbi:MAG: leucine-rich repeat domain-containing protein [Acutalibacteraceae bacterium]|nr:leucine-rich repeat domain-containing protein [Acutalibacteraceae bacterium]